MAVWKPTREEVQVLNEYHHALNIYYDAVLNWLDRFDTHAEAEEQHRLTDEKDIAERTCTNLRAALDRFRAAHS